MKHFILVTAFFMLFSFSKAQDSTKHFEVGATLATVGFYSYNNFSHLNSDPVFNYPNGLLFRYIKKRFGVRALVTYSQKKSSFPWDETDRMFTVGVGGQFSLLKKEEWLYTFIDFSYRNSSSKGSYGRDSSVSYNTYNSSTNGVNTALGIGFKLKLFKCIYLSPEVGYVVFIENGTYLQRNNNYILSKGSTVEKYMEIMARVHLTVKF